MTSYSLLINPIYALNSLFKNMFGEILSGGEWRELNSSLSNFCSPNILRISKEGKKNLKYLN